MRKFNRLCLALLCAFAPASFAEDTDIYAANDGSANNPNVLIMIDNSANWAAASQHWPDGIKQGQAELNALREVLSELGADVNVGLMLFTPGAGTAKDGGYVRYHIRPMTDVNKTAFQQMLGDPAGCTNGANSLNNTPNCIYQNFASGALNESVGTAKTDYSATMFEIFKYFGGYTSRSLANSDTAGDTIDASHFGALRYAGNPESRSDRAAYKTLADGSADPNLLQYNSPLSASNSCASNYLIFIGNGYPTQDSPVSLLTGVGETGTQLPVADFRSVTGSSQTQLATSQTFASQAECEAAAASTYGDSYDSYVCGDSTTVTESTSLNETSCGTYDSVNACQAAAAVTYGNSYQSYSCTLARSDSGVVDFGTSACGVYSSVDDCKTKLAAAKSGYSNHACTLDTSVECSASTTLLNNQTTCGSYKTQPECESAANTIYYGQGYNSFSCTTDNSLVCQTDLGTTSCYVSSNACATGVLATHNKYDSVSCTSPVNCLTTKDVCAGSGVYNTQDKCNSEAPKELPVGSYASYTCGDSTYITCASKSDHPWRLAGITQRYTATGTGKSWRVYGNKNAGSRYSMSAEGSCNVYAVSGTTTTTRWNVYGLKTITVVTPQGSRTGYSPNYADEWASFLYQTDVSSVSGRQFIRTYTIDVFKDAQDSDQTKLLMSMAHNGGGEYHSATNAAEIKNALRKIFSEIQSKNSVFASSSLPVSVNTQGTYLNQVFIGMFRPHGSAKPRWAGNLKQYQFAIDKASKSLFLADKIKEPAINSTTGFIKPCAKSLWTTNSGANYWNFSGSDAIGGCPATDRFSDLPDGDIVEKGGVAQKIRGALTNAAGTLITNSTRYQVCADGTTPYTAACRKLLTCDLDNCSSLVEFSTTNAGSGSSNPSLTASSLGATDLLGNLSDAERDLLIDWVRGKDVYDENHNDITEEVRPSVHGAVVHSQPAVVDYGGDVGVYSFYGADDGLFHAADGGKTDAEGVEVWGFIAPETYARIKRYRDNEPLVDMPGVRMDITPTPQPKTYFFDGSVGIYQKNGTVWIYPTMRRGGRAIYSFDVSTPTAPSLKWRKGCFTSDTADNSNCSVGWTDIGQTWSKPQIAYLSGYTYDGGSPRPVLVFGGGYDICEDIDSQQKCSTSPRKGANVWFVDADTGDIIRKYPTHYSVPGDVFISKNSSGYITYVYAVDSGGYVYRINAGSIPIAAETTWTSNSSANNIAIALLSENNQARKFLFGPDVVNFANYTAVLVGSGDREHPLLNDYACKNFAANASPPQAGEFVTNQFYMVKDRPTSYPATPVTAADLTDVTNDARGNTTINSYGWKFSLAACEQVVNKALSIGGLVFFGTNQPKNTAISACDSNLGVARGYSVSIEDAEAPCANCSRYTTYTGGGMPPSPVAGVVDIDGEKVPFLLGGSIATSISDNQCVGEGCSPLGGAKIEINPAGARYRTYWYIEKD